MGQKINPTIFRLSKTNNWKSKYFEKKIKDSKVYNFKDVEIRKFIIRFFNYNGLLVHDLKLLYYNNTLHVFISYFPTLKTISLINTTNKSQKIKLVTKKISNNKYTHYTQIKQNIKKHIKYKKLNNFFINKKNKKTKFRRIKFLKYYKNYLITKQNKQISNIQLNSFLTSFFQSLSLFTNNKINISLTLNKLNNDIKYKIQKKKLKIIKKKLIKLRKYKNTDFFKKGINTLFLTITKKNSAMMLAYFIANELKILKRHNFFLRFLKNSLTLLNDKTFSKLKGIKIKIKGRFNRAPRARHKIIEIGNSVPNLTLKSNINYFETTSFSSNGTFGVKVWVCEKY